MWWVVGLRGRGGRLLLWGFRETGGGGGRCGEGGGGKWRQFRKFYEADKVRMFSSYFKTTAANLQSLHEVKVLPKKFLYGSEKC